MLIDIIAGARANFIEIAPIIGAIKVIQSNGADLRYRLIHTGQHYDENMSQSLFRQNWKKSPYQRNGMVKRLIELQVF